MLTDVELLNLPNLGNRTLREIRDAQNRILGITDDVQTARRGVVIDHMEKKLAVRVKRSSYGGIAIHQGDDLVYVGNIRLKDFVAAVRAIASDILGEEV